MKNYVTKYSEFIFEKDEISELKGIPPENMIKKMESIMEVLPESTEFGVPSDNLGQSTSYKNINNAIQRIKDIAHYYKKRKQAVKFYCWSVTFKGNFKAIQELEEMMEEADALYHENKKKYGKVDLMKIKDYIEANPEDSDEFKSFSISLDSNASRNFGVKLSEIDDEDEEVEVKEKIKEEE